MPDFNRPKNGEVFFLDAYTGAAIGKLKPSLGDIREYQLKELIKIFNYAKANSKFYKNLYKNTPALKGFEDFAALPLINSEDIRENGIAMVCKAQDEIKRIFTLDTGGTTGLPKRLFFSDDEIQRTVDFFTSGQIMFVSPQNYPEDKWFILLPCRQENSVGHIFGKSCHKAGVEPVYYGLPEDNQAAYKSLIKSKANTVLAAPKTMLALAALNKENYSLKSVLLSSDSISPHLKEQISRSFSCPVFEHYGMTEICFGGGIDCRYLKGYHMRESDLYTEILDKEHKPVKAGEWGQVVITTLHHFTMPLIRYATGDISRFIPEPCPCGSPIPLLDRIRPREGEKAFSMI